MLDRGVCACAGCGVIAAVVLTEGTVGNDGASKLARHGMVLGFGVICGVCACAGCGGAD